MSSGPCGSRNVAPIPFSRYELISREIILDVSKFACLMDGHFPFLQLSEGRIEELEVLTAPYGHH